jgi:hypothetical protein
MAPPPSIPGSEAAKPARVIGRFRGHVGVDVVRSSMAREGMGFHSPASHDDHGYFALWNLTRAQFSGSKSLPNLELRFTESFSSRDSCRQTEGRC